MVRLHLARGVAVTTLIFALAATRASAQDATPAASPPGVPANCTVVASGLLNPRHVVVADDGTLYITETGTGGDMPGAASDVGTSEVATPADGTPAADSAAAQPAATRGTTGRVTVVAPDGTQSVLSDGFVSYSAGTGPSGIQLIDGMLYVAVGGNGAISGLDELDGENAVFTVDPSTGTATQLADIGAYEIANNPDGTDVNPNLYDLRQAPDGTLYVVDAGGNATYTLDPTSGQFSEFKIFPTLDVLTGTASNPSTPATEGEGGPRQVVPTSMTFDRDGNPVVSFLGEAWPADAPSIVRVNADGSLKVLVTGQQMLVSLATAPDGTMYATQLTSDLSTFAPGDILRVNDDGSTTPVLEGLITPQGIAFDGSGGIYVVTNSVAMGPPNGQVLHCTDFDQGTSRSGGTRTASVPAAVRP